MEKKISKFFYIRRVLRGVLFLSKRKKNRVKREKACSIHWSKGETGMKAKHTFSLYEA